MATVMMLSVLGFLFIVIDFIMTNAKTLRIENLYQKFFFKVKYLNKLQFLCFMDFSSCVQYTIVIAYCNIVRDLQHCSVTYSQIC